MTYEEWAKIAAVELKKYPLVKSKWKNSNWKRLYKDGLTPNEAVSLCILNH